MSSRLLKEDDVIRALHEQRGLFRSDKDAQRFAVAIEAIPSADRPQGKWIPATWQDENCPERLKRHKCSECGQRAEQILVRTELVDNYYCNKAEPITEYTHKEQLSKYCPNCGARMKGADDE